MTQKQLNLNKIKKELKTNAQALDIPSGSADIFIEKIIKSLPKTLGSSKIITDQDLNRALIKEIKKYHADLAYVYENHDKII